MSLCLLLTKRILTPRDFDWIKEWTPPGTHTGWRKIIISAIPAWDARPVLTTIYVLLVGVSRISENGKPNISEPTPFFAVPNLTKPKLPWPGTTSKHVGAVNSEHGCLSKSEVFWFAGPTQKSTRQNTPYPRIPNLWISFFMKCTFCVWSMAYKKNKKPSTQTSVKFSETVLSHDGMR